MNSETALRLLVKDTDTKIFLFRVKAMQEKIKRDKAQNLGDILTSEASEGVRVIAIAMGANSGGCGRIDTALKILHSAEKTLSAVLEITNAKARALEARAEPFPAKGKFPDKSGVRENLVLLGAGKK